MRRQRTMVTVQKFEYFALILIMFKKKVMYALKITQAIQNKPRKSLTVWELNHVLDKWSYSTQDLQDMWANFGTNI